MKDPTDPAIPVDRVLRALADSSRLAIVERLTEGPSPSPASQRRSTSR